MFRNNFEDKWVILRSHGAWTAFLLFLALIVFPQEHVQVFERPVTFTRQIELFKNIINILVYF